MSGEPKSVNVRQLARMKRERRKLVMLTAYDALFASLVDQEGVDVVLVGDSVNTLLCGEDTTLSATLDQMIYHGRIVRAGVRRALVVVDMPFLSFQVSIEDAKRNAGRVLKETGAHGVKLEGGEPVVPTVQALVEIGIPVMGHLGFTPQSVHALGGYRVQGRDADAAAQIIAAARSLEAVGAFSIVLELMPSSVARQVTEAVNIPTIGIGSGPHCDGQVLVLHDMLGLNEGFRPKFLKRYADLGEAVRSAIRTFASDVREGRYPDAEHSYEE
ncbi:MAG: 3-methyl-2-oxobutanoate hydroxymethyltransferase [Gemmatimonadales bacterium]|nr:3-methyl-2-oxobutanoate hydroxymethyltransferase [Gemmatimonadales bacterium]NIN12479.1 3-methyl-2-oxobutanoate hydroxymethyltransferase [Gemmatimonadales bacterium]NIN50855.1 3-methyl-2-oxobutanoate hydroxymethyltransferase [Gemmatimonadales bacterium]NIP08319.1 3-methyl-2-oxobutanoate hydroxymethyltransferase [Gemmatimonadales bacterium]NIR00843.1 3-methyl-2-oxobutanoate hydroxymethyltransferase [Gemmatimonadales bacterium]